MKKTANSLLFFLGLFLLTVSTTHAHYLYLQPQGEITAESGSQVTVGAYLHATQDDKIFGYGVTQEFDPIELTRESYDFGAGIGSIGTVLYGPATGHTIEYYWGDNYTYLSRYDWSFVGLAITADTDYLLYTVTYTFNGGAFDGDDAWLNNALGEDPFVEFEFTWLGGAGYFGVGEMPVEGGGVDYASTPAVPIPGAIWLLGMGLLRLAAGARKRERL